MLIKHTHPGLVFGHSKQRGQPPEAATVSIVVIYVGHVAFALSIANVRKRLYW